MDRPRKRWKENYQQPWNGIFCPIVVMEDEEENHSPGIKAQKVTSLIQGQGI
jgi:hypothetical protein